MRLLVWHWGRRGGGPRYTFELARALAARDDARTHLSLSRQSEWFEASTALGLPGLHVDTYASLPGMLAGLARLPQLRRRFARYIRTRRIEVVLCTMAHLWNGLVSDVIAPAGARYVLVVHDADPHPGEANALRDLVDRRDILRADRLIALTRHVQAEIGRAHV